jgi:hypothetical protein
MKRISLASAFVLMWAATVAVAQSSPSFVGKWTLSSGPTLGWGPEFTTSQDSLTLTVVRASGGAKFVYNLDGSESTNTVLIGGQQISQRCNLKRDGAKIVLTSVYHAQGFDIRRTETWEIAPSGDLSITFDYLQGDKSTSHTTKYRKS